MARHYAEQNGDPVVAAMDRVLKAERDGVTLLRESQGKAERLLGEARAGAAAIALRIDGRVSRLHVAYLQKIQRDIDAMNTSNASHESGNAYERAALEAAAFRVALKLTSDL
jgi:regulator of protease activity HflC (stomatin/prohibitin superfamily)